MLRICVYCFIFIILAQFQLTCVKAFDVIRQPFRWSSVGSHSCTSISRRNIITGWIAGSVVLPFSPAIAYSDKISLSSSIVIASSLFDDVRNELTSNTGGISYLKACIDSQDYTSILEFTKEYDLNLRKDKMGKARKSLQDKEKKEKALYYANAVTFDLIGMNKNSRKGVENMEQVSKYFEELKNDLKGFIALEQD